MLEVIVVLHLPKKTFSVTLPLELYECLKLRADAIGLTVPAYMRQVLKRYAGRLEQSKPSLDDWWLI